MRRLVSYLHGLPGHSVLRAELGDYDRDDGLWTTDRELTAQVVELLSIVATREHALRKPVQVTRPGQPAGASVKRNPDAMPPGEAARVLLAQRHLRMVR